MTWLEEFWSRIPSPSEYQCEELFLRGVTETQIEKFQIRVIEDEIPSLEGCPKEFLDWTCTGDNLINRILFPLTNSRNEISGFQIRYLDRTKKGYSDFFATDDEAVTFGLGQVLPSIWSTEKVLLVEGTYDFLVVEQHVPWSLPVLSSTPSDNLWRLLQRFVKVVYIGFDNDGPGQHGTRQLIKASPSWMMQHSVQWPRHLMRHGVESKRTKDPGDLWVVLGSKGLETLLKNTLEI